MNILVTHSNSPAGCAMRIAAHKTKLDKYIFTDRQGLSAEAIDAIHARVRKGVDTATRLLNVNDETVLRRIVREERIGMIVVCDDAGIAPKIRQIMDEENGYQIRVTDAQEALPIFRSIEDRVFEEKDNCI